MSEPAFHSADRPKLGIWTKLAYAFGGVSYGVKGNGFTYFLMLCYAQAFGLPAEQVGLAMLLAFMFDAFSDPLIGYLSDNTKGRLGRRHLYMYAAIIPVGIIYYMLWNPPASVIEDGLFWYLLAMSIGMRVLITFYEVPCTAMNAELTTDYDERTSLLTLRAVVVYMGGVVMAATTLAFILQPDATGSAFTDAEGFGRYGLIAALVMMASMLVCSLGTHRFIPYLAKADAVPGSLGKMLKEIFQTLRSPSLAALFASQLAGYAAFGVAAALAYYMQGYFWGFSGDQSSIITVSILVSAMLALFIGPPVAKRIGKRQAAFFFGLGALILVCGPITLRLLGLMPENGDPSLFWIILVATALEYSMIIAMNAIVQAMVADLVEEAELRTERRSEGLMFAVMTFTRKAVEGVGVLSASLIIALAALPENAEPSDITPETATRLGLFYLPAVFIFWALMLVFITRYTLTREDHEANLQALAARASANITD